MIHIAVWVELFLCFSSQFGCILLLYFVIEIEWDFRCCRNFFHGETDLVFTSTPVFPHNTQTVFWIEAEGKGLVQPYELIKRPKTLSIIVLVHDLSKKIFEADA